VPVSAASGRRGVLRVTFAHGRCLSARRNRVDRHCEGSAVSSRRQAVANEELADMETKRLHDDLTPQFALTLNPGYPGEFGTTASIMLTCWAMWLSYNRDRTLGDREQVAIAQAAPRMRAGNPLRTPGRSTAPQPSSRPPEVLVT
jgi:hypothetical protein